MLVRCMHSALTKALNAITSPRDAFLSIHHAVTPPVDTAERSSGVMDALFMRGFCKRVRALSVCRKDREALKVERNIWNHFRITQETCLRISQSAFQQWLMKLYSLFSAWEYAGVYVRARLC